MSTTYSNTAILLFSRSVDSENENKRILKGRFKFGNRELISILSKDVRKELHISGLPVFWVDEKQQQGSNFGERLANAFRFVYQKGFENVIAVGGDVLDLNSRDILLAKSQLEKGSAVLGPSLDGGDYLIGLNQVSFQAIDFDSLSWQSNILHAQLCKASKQLGDVFILRQLLDVDDQDDFSLACEKGLVSQAFIRLLFAGFTAFHNFNDTSFLEDSSVSLQGLRAPPAAA